MAQGIEVLQAALAGQLVRVKAHDPISQRWLRWCATCHTFEWDGVGHSPPYEVMVGVHQLWQDEWEIQERTLTFAEAVAAMDAGQTVTKGDGTTQYRWEGSDYWYHTDGHHEWFPDAVFGWEEIHATDWRIVREEPQAERPTVPTQAEAIEYLCSFHLEKVYPDLFSDYAHSMLRLAIKWPAMFREEG